MAWVGTVHLGLGALAFVGTVGATPAHRHAAHQVLVVEGPGAIRVDLGEESLGSVRAIVIPGGTMHAVAPDHADVSALSVYVDVDTRQGQMIDDAVRERPPCGWTDAASTVTAQWPQSPDRAGIDALVGYLATPAGSLDVHPYVRAALDTATAHLPGSLTLTDLAAAVNVSVPHLSRLWRRDLGLSFNAWVRWTRLRDAARRISNGDSLTDAAHSAGFADGAHASRVCREMFGLAPATLLGGVSII